MDLKEHLRPDRLEHYGFLWSETRLVVAAVSLFIGGFPVVWFVLPAAGLYGLVATGLKLAWIISGAASAYLLYRWNAGGRKLFGKSDQKDAVAFLVSVVTGLNLGITGLLGTNIGMSILSSRPVFVITAVIYLSTALYLFSRWQSSGKKLF